MPNKMRPNVMQSGVMQSGVLQSSVLCMAVVLALSVAGCASQPKPETGGALAPMEMQCDTDAAKAAIGQRPSDGVVEQARIDAGAKSTRVLRSDQAATLDFRGDRLNIRLADDGMVKSLDCG